MNKEIKRIFIVLSLFSFAGGLFYNFQQLWMIDNNLSVKTIGIVLSLGALLSVSTIFLCSNLIKQNKLKKFVCLLLFLKALNIIVLFFLNGSGLNILIKFLTMLDYVLDVEIYASIYPMISLISQDDKLYAKRGLYYSTFYYLAVLLTGFLLGKNIFIFKVNYNFYLIITAIFIIIAFLILMNTDMEKYSKNDVQKNVDNDILFKLVKKIKNDIISKNYLAFIFFGDIAYYSVQSLLIIVLTKYVGFTPVFSSNFILLLGILAVILASLVLKFTFKNNYINISIKYVGRLITFLMALILCNNASYLIAMMYLILTSESYTHVTHAPYINRFKGEYQFAFSNLNEIVSYLSRSIGTLLCSLLIEINLRYVFLAVIVFTTFQIIFAMNALRLRNKESMLKMINNDWDLVLSKVFEGEGFKKIYSIVEKEYETKTIFPLKENIFNALKLTPYNDVKVVIVGQDPYHGVGEAHGLSFSVQKGIKLPPSLKNIYKELYDDLKIEPCDNGDLTKWAKQGVLLLNAVLTVEKDKPASHRNLGWESLTDYIIKTLNSKEEPIVFILWGNFAKEKKSLITNPKHLIIESAHPSPFSARYGFFGSKPFSRTNNFLEKNNIVPIDWNLKE